MVEFHVTDDVAQGGRREVLDRRDRALHTVGVQLRVRDLEIDDGVDLHGDVIARDHGLRREVDNLLLQRNLLCDAVNERDFEMQAGAPCGMEGAETLEYIGVCLRNDFDVRDHNDDGQNDQNGND